MIEEIRKKAPIIDFNQLPLYNKEKIKSILPHREPFLFIDEIREIGDDFIIGTKLLKKKRNILKDIFHQNRLCLEFYN